MDHYDELAQLFEGPDGDLFKPTEKPLSVTPDKRLEDSFKEIETFVRRNDRLPSQDSDDFKEKLLCRRLDNIRTDQTKREKLLQVDSLGLLEEEKAPETLDELFKEDAWLFKGEVDIFNTNNIPQEQRVVQNNSEADRRQECKNFQEYEPLFKEQQTLLRNGERKLVFFRNINQLQPGNFYVYDGLMCYVVSFDQKERKAGGYSQQRMTVIFENGTESHMYRRSLAQRLYEGGTIVVGQDYADNTPPSTTENVTGYIYVLQSLSTDPKISTIKNLYKIGRTDKTIDKRIKNAVNDPTYLMAPVKVVERYRLQNSVSPAKVEDLLHHFFADAKVELTIVDQNGFDYTPQEWYAVPLSIINEAIDLLRTGEIVNCVYDGKSQSIMNIQDKEQYSI